MEEERIVTINEIDGDNFLDNIRPDSFSEYIGQNEVKENIKVQWKILN